MCIYLYIRNQDFFFDFFWCVYGYVVIYNNSASEPFIIYIYIRNQDYFLYIYIIIIFFGGGGVFITIYF